MADALDVSNTLVGMISGALFPNGTSQPCIAGVPVIVYAGWPDPDTLDADMQGMNNNVPTARVHVSVYPSPNAKRTTKYRNEYMTPVSSNPATLTLTVNANTVTIGGTVSTPQNVGLLVGGYQAQLPYTYAVQPTDTPATVASALAALIPGASSSGVVVTCPDGAVIQNAIAGGTATLQAEVRRQKRNWQISVWSGNPTAREWVASVIDNMFAQVKFINLPDGFVGRFLFENELENDERQAVQIYSRRLFYSVEYATTATTTSAQVVTVEIGIATGVTGVEENIDNIVIYQ